MGVKAVVIEVPEWVIEEEVKEAIEKYLFKKYGIVPAEALRRKLGIKPLKTKSKLMKTS